MSSTAAPLSSVLTAPLDDPLAPTGSGSDPIVSANNTDDPTYPQTDGDDIYSDPNNIDDSIDGGAGDDVFFGNGGNNTLIGGDGQDHLYGGNDNDTLDGGNGDDLLFPNEGTNVVSGGAGNDLLYGGNTFDTLDGGDGDDLLEGNGGIDIVDGGAGNDEIQGGGGDDTIIGGTDDGTVECLTHDGDGSDDTDNGADDPYEAINFIPPPHLTEGSRQEREAAEGVTPDGWEELPFVAEARIGNNALNGDHEMTLGESTGNPQVMSTGQLTYERNGGFDFSLTVDADGAAQWTVDGVTIEYDFGALPDEFDALVLRGFSNDDQNARNEVYFDNIQLNGNDLDFYDNPSRADDAFALVSYAEVFSWEGYDFSQGFTFSGTAEFRWANGDMPLRSNLAFQIKAFNAPGDAPEPEEECTDHAITVGDNLYGNDGADLFQYAAGDGVDLIWDFKAGEGDVIRITGYDDLEQMVAIAPENVTVPGRVNAGNDGTDREGPTVNVPGDDNAEADFYRPLLILSEENDDAILLHDLPADAPNGAVIEFVDSGISYSVAEILAIMPSNVAVNTTGDDDDNELFGSNGADLVEAGEGNDTVFAGLEDDNISGGDGDDFLFGGVGDDVIDGGDGRDFVGIQGNRADFTIEQDDNGAVIVTNSITGEVDTLINIEELAFDDAWVPLAPGVNGSWYYGGIFDDTFSGSDGDDGLYGDTGNDSLSAGGGNDYIDGGLGSDTIDGGDGNDFLGAQVSLNDVTLSTQNNTTLIITHANGDVDQVTNVEGVGFTDGYLALQAGVVGSWHYGTLFNETITGTDGSDGLFGDGGNDTVSGGGGDDYFHGVANDGSDSLDGGAGNDFLGLQAPQSNYAISQNQDGSIRLEDTTNGDVDTLVSVEAIGFSDGGIVVVGAQQWGDWFQGGIYDDAITGRDGTDGMGGGTGNDTLDAGGGDDYLRGDDGADRLIGGAGNDFLVGNAGADTFVFDSASGFDFVEDFEAGVDGIELASGTNYFAEANDGGTWISFGNDAAVLLSGVDYSTFSTDWISIG